MRHQKRGRKLNRTASHRKAMLNNMATSVLLHESIVTTVPKAKEVRGHVDRLITLGKAENKEHAYRLAARRVNDKDALHLLFNDYRERFADRNGGYTRVVHIGPRTGDNAPMAVIQLVDAVVRADALHTDDEPEEATA